MKNILSENMKRFGTKNLTESDIKKINEGAQPWSVDDGSMMNITTDELQPLVNALNSTLNNQVKITLKTTSTTYKTTPGTVPGQRFELLVDGKSLNDLMGGSYSKLSFIATRPIYGKDELSKKVLSFYLIQNMRRFEPDAASLKGNIKAQQQGGTAQATAIKNGIADGIWRIFGISQTQSKAKQWSAVATYMYRVFVLIIALKIRIGGIRRSDFQKYLNVMINDGFTRNEQFDLSINAVYKKLQYSNFENYINTVRQTGSELGAKKANAYLQDNDIPFTGLIPV